MVPSRKYDSREARAQGIDRDHPTGGAGRHRFVQVQELGRLQHGGHHQLDPLVKSPPAACTFSSRASSARCQRAAVGPAAEALDEALAQAASPVRGSQGTRAAAFSDRLLRQRLGGVGVAVEVHALQRAGGVAEEAIGDGVVGGQRQAPGARAGPAGRAPCCGTGRRSAGAAAPPRHGRRRAGPASASLRRRCRRRGRASCPPARADRDWPASRRRCRGCRHRGNHPPTRCRRR